MSNAKLEMAFGDRNGAGGFGGKSGGGGRGGGREDRGERGDRGSDMERGGGRGFGRRKVCRYCADKNLKVDYKNTRELKYLLTHRRKILPRRHSRHIAPP